MRFSDIPGHDDIKKRLRAMADADRIPHAILLEGPSGTAKYALARAMAQYIHCTNRSEEDSCGVCASCKQHQSFNNADTYYSFPVVKRAGKDAISDDFLPAWRLFLAENPMMDFQQWTAALDNINAQPRIYVEEGIGLIRKLSLTAMAADYKIVLMWLPERMKTECANKMLKLVEEPFSDTIFIMASDNPREILPTIYSRTQRISVKRYTDAEVSDYLSMSYGVGKQQADDIARISDGSIINALRHLSTGSSTSVQLDLFMRLMRLSYQRKVRELKAWSVEIAGMGREPQMSFLSYCQRLFRENFIMNLNIPPLNLLTSAEAAFCAKFSPFINERNVLKINSIFDDAIADIAANANAKIVFFDLAIKCVCS